MILVLKEVAALLRLSEDSCRDQMAAGEIPGWLRKRSGAKRGRWVCRKADLEAYLERQSGAQAGRGGLAGIPPC